MVISADKILYPVPLLEPTTHIYSLIGTAERSGLGRGISGSFQVAQVPYFPGHFLTTRAGSTARLGDLYPSAPTVSAYRIRRLSTTLLKNKDGSNFLWRQTKPTPSTKNKTNGVRQTYLTKAARKDIPHPWKE